MKRTEMVLRGTEQLRATEKTIAVSICDTADLISSLERMRMDSGLSFVIGQEVMDSLNQTLTSLTTARGKMVQAHGHLNDVKTQIGCATVMTGHDDDKPPLPPRGLLPLRVVGDSRAA